MLLGYGLALAILRALYVHWRDAWREPDSVTTYAKRTLPLLIKQRIELTRGFMRRDRDMYGPQHTYRLDNINNLCQLLVPDLDFHRASAWYEYGLENAQPTHQAVAITTTAITPVLVAAAAKTTKSN